MTEEKQEPTEEEIRKAWEARLAKNASAKTVYVNSDTGRRMDVTETLYDIIAAANRDAGSNRRSAW